MLTRLMSFARVRPWIPPEKTNKMENKFVSTWAATDAAQMAESFGKSLMNARVVVIRAPNKPTWAH